MDQRGVVHHNEHEELFNLEEDPHQTRNVYTKYPMKARELKKILEQLKKHDHSMEESRTLNLVERLQK